MTDAGKSTETELVLLQDGTNTGVLVCGKTAVFFNCAAGREAIKPLGIEKVEKICLCSYRRSASGSLREYPSAEIYAPLADVRLLADTGSFWSDEERRWHLYEFRPDDDVHIAPVSNVIGVCEPYSFDFHGARVSAVSTPGDTEHGISWIVELNGATVAFCGDIIREGGKYNDLGCLARPVPPFPSYHGFLRGKDEIYSSAEKLINKGVQVIVPPFGGTVANPAGDLRLLRSRLDALYDNYVSISAANDYVENLYTRYYESPPELMPRGSVCSPPEFVLHMGGTTKLLLSENGEAFMFDAGSADALDAVDGLIAQKKITKVCGCFITHYHDDHTDFIGEIKKRYDAPVYCLPVMADILENPLGYRLACISPANCEVVTYPDGEGFDWNEFKFTFYNFPGQTVYHGALFAQGRGMNILFAGDSFSPTGIDDYNLQNRCFVREDKGNLYALALVEKLSPDCMICAHRVDAFSFTAAQTDFMREKLRTRILLLNELSALPSGDYSTDPLWLRAYPYEQDVPVGGSTTIELQFTNHSDKKIDAIAKIIMPPGFIGEYDDAVALPPLTDGVCDGGGKRPDLSVIFEIDLPDFVKPGKYAVAFEIMLDGVRYGQKAAAVINVI